MREAVRHAVRGGNTIRAAPRSGGDRLWPAWLAGQWRLFDAFTSGAERYLVAIRNPDLVAAQRALGPRERVVLEHALAGRSGKWTASELNLSESVIARTLRLALDKLG